MHDGITQFCQWLLSCFCFAFEQIDVLSSLHRSPTNKKGSQGPSWLAFICEWRIIYLSHIFTTHIHLPFLCLYTKSTFDITLLDRNSAVIVGPAVPQAVLVNLHQSDFYVCCLHACCLVVTCTGLCRVYLSVDFAVVVCVCDIHMWTLRWLIFSAALSQSSLLTASPGRKRGCQCGSPALLFWCLISHYVAEQEDRQRLIAQNIWNFYW